MLVVAGPNGSGKSTFIAQMIAGASAHDIHLPIPDRILNPDEVARSIDAVNPDRVAMEAARVVLRQRAEFLRQRLDFAVETTLSGNSEIRLVEDARRVGYEIGLIYIATQNSKQNVLRVELRQQEQNRSVPPADVLRRFERSLSQLSQAVALADLAYIYDNTGSDFVRLATSRNGRLIEIGAKLPAWFERALKPQLDGFHR